MISSENKLEWLEIGSIKILSFMTTDILIFGAGCGLKFFNINTGENKVMVVNRSCEDGEAIQLVEGHRNVLTFAYTDMYKNKLYVKGYPNFNTHAIFEDSPPGGFTSLTFSSRSLIIALGGFPEYSITVWNWMDHNKLGYATGYFPMEFQELRCNWSRSICMIHLAIGTNKILLWDVFVVLKMLTKSELSYKNNTVEFSDAVWTPEDVLYIVDRKGCIYSVNEEFVIEREVDVDIQGDNRTTIVAYKSGLSVSGPNNDIRHYVKTDSWECIRTITLEVGIRELFCYKADYIIAVTLDERVVKIVNTKVTSLKNERNKINDFCLINPAGEHLVVLRHNHILDIWTTTEGKQVTSTELTRKALVLAGNPELPYVAIGYDNGILELISVYTPEKPYVLTQFELTRNCIDNVKFFEQGRMVVAGCSDIGEYFVIEGFPGSQMKIITHILVERQIVDFMLVSSNSCYRLFLIPVTANCLAGNEIIRYCILGKNNYEVKTYSLENENYLYSQFFPIKTHTRDRIFYAVPFNSRSIHLLETKRGDPLVRIISEIKTGHQMQKVGLHITKFHAVTWAYDGFIIARDSNFEKNVGMALPHHRYLGGVHKARIDPFGKYIISLGNENSLICTDIVNNKIDPERKSYIEELRNSVKVALMFRRPTFGFMPTGRFENKTWLEVEEILEFEREEEICRNERQDILSELADIKVQMNDLVTKNLAGPENEKLDLPEFYLDLGLLHTKEAINRDECKQTKIYLKALIVAQDKVTRYLMENYWNKMALENKSLFGFFVSTIATNYSLLPENEEKLKRLAWIAEQRRVEKFLSIKGSFVPWNILPEEKILKIIERPHLVKEDYGNIDLIHLLDNLHVHSNIPLENKLAILGAVSLQYIELSPSHYAQREFFTFYQCDIQQSVAEQEVTKLKFVYNRAFDDLMVQKHKEMDYIINTNARLRNIISEFNYFSTKKIDLVIVDPKWNQRELPERLITVMDSEMSVTPYVSPSEQLIIDTKAAEEERIRLALLADDFKERALMMMMNGILEQKWEDELKLEVPVPKCALTKDPENFDIEDLRTMKDYEDKVAFLRSERERYKKLLDNDFTKVTTHLRDLIRKFNQRVKDTLEFKMNVDSAANQENLKVNRARWKQNERIKLMDEETDIYDRIKDTEKSIIDVRQHIASVAVVLTRRRKGLEDCHVKDRSFERPFKKDIQHLSNDIEEKVWKVYKRRPKVVFPLSTTPGDYKALARAVRSRVLPGIYKEECVKFIRTLNRLDDVVAVPAGIDLQTRKLIVNHRRLKIESEIWIRHSQAKIMDAEGISGQYQKRLNMCREKLFRLHNDVSEVRTKYKYLIHNLQVQIVLRRGLVEVPLTGNIQDFDDAVLIPKTEILFVNELIQKAGQNKLKAILQNMAFRRSIMNKEWEHQKLRREYNEGLEHLDDIEDMKVTRDMLAFIRSKTHTFDLSAEVEIDKIAQSYQFRLDDKKRKLEKLEIEIVKYKENSEALDSAIKCVNLDICDLVIHKDDKLKNKETELINARTTALLRRSKLVQEIQDNHNNIMILQTELELLRLKTYPMFKYKVINL